MSRAVNDVPRSGSRRWLLRAAAAAVLAVAAPRAGAEALTFEFAVVNGAVPANMRVVRVKEGDAVTLRFKSDKALALHLHGYEIEARVAPGGTATMTFDARLTGRFPVHVHGVGGAQANAESVLVEVEVYPR